jgi:hypothetical protein
MEMNMPWYHGTPIEFETFDPAFVGRGNDELGSGFYFTDNFDTAKNYALKAGDAEDRVVLVAEFEIDSPLPLEGGFTLDQIEQIMRASSEFDDVLMNFGDVDYEGEAKVVGFAVKTYATTIEGDTLTGLNALSNDFYQGREAEFLRAVNVVSGYDGLIRQKGGEQHAVVWLPERIKIVERLKPAEMASTMSPG